MTKQVDGGRVTVRMNGINIDLALQRTTQEYVPLARSFRNSDEIKCVVIAKTC